MPKSWSEFKICETFQVFEYLVQKARKMKKECGVLPCAKFKNNCIRIPTDIKEKIIKFYEEN